MGGGTLLLVLSSCLLAAPHDSERARLVQDMDLAIVRDRIPSLVAVIFDDRQIVWTHVAGYSDLAARTPPTLRTRYRLGSTAKAVTSTVLAIAEQRQWISFGAAVTVSGAGGPGHVSVSDLVNMQAGLAQAVCYDGIGGDANPDCGAGFNQRYGVSITRGPDRYSYSNMGPQLAADSLSFKRRRSFDRIARELLFGPAGMAGATFDHSNRNAPTATGYDRDGKRYDNDFRIVPEAGAGLEASAEDLVRFGQLHLTGRAPDGSRLLSARTLERLHSSPNGGFYGYGWGHIGAGRPTELLIADGQVNGGQAMLVINPVKSAGALVISNMAHDKVNELALAAMDTVVPGTIKAFTAALETAQKTHQSEIERFLPPADFDGTGEIRVNGNRLAIILSSRGKRLRHTIAGRSAQEEQSEEDEGFRGWKVPCYTQIPSCRRPGAKAKLWLSRDRGGLGGQVQVTSFDGQLPYPVIVRLRSKRLVRVKR